MDRQKNVNCNSGRVIRGGSGRVAITAAAEPDDDDDVSIGANKGRDGVILAVR